MIGKLRLILRDSAISLGMRMTREFPDLATLPLLSRPNSPLLLTPDSICSINFCGRYSAPHLVHTSASFTPKSIPKNSTSATVFLSLPPHLHLMSKIFSDVKAASPRQETDNINFKIRLKSPQVYRNRSIQRSDCSPIYLYTSTSDERCSLRSEECDQRSELFRPAESSKWNGLKHILLHLFP